MPNGESVLTIPKEVENRIIYKAFLARKVEERLLQAFSEGKLFGTVHTCIGQEFSGAVISEFLEKGDVVFSNHRCHGHFLSITSDPEGLISEIMGRKTGVCSGKGGSQHLCSDSFYSNGIQGGIVPVAAGLALARKMNRQDAIAVVFIGDGTLGQGVVYETLNIASKWALPLLVVLENNFYAQSTSQAETLAGEISPRVAAFGISVFKADTWEWKNLYCTAEEAFEHVRKGRKPGFLQIDTFRLKAHSKGDDNRPREAVAPYEIKDPLNQLLQDGSPSVTEMLERIDARVETGFSFAEENPIPCLVNFADAGGTLQWNPEQLPRKKVGRAINEALTELMTSHPEMLILGEDVRDPYGGAFGITRGLSELFPDRVLNTPISEAAIVGIGSGLAMEGYRPFVEIMFGDFMTLALDQLLNHACKFEYMYDGQVSVNLVVRTPMGGRRGYGPTHSQTLDRHFLGIPGLRVVAINNLVSPNRVYESVLEHSLGPVLIIENKVQYGKRLCSKPPEGFLLFSSDEVFPTAYLAAESNWVDLTLVSYGGMSDILIKAADRLFEEYDLICQVVCPTQIYPFQVKPLLSILTRGRAVVIVEEGQGFAAFGSEFAAQLLELVPHKRQKLKRIFASACPIPASGPLEDQVLPQLEQIISVALELTDEA